MARNTFYRQMIKMDQALPKSKTNLSSQQIADAEATKAVAAASQVYNAPSSGNAQASAAAASSGGGGFLDDLNPIDI